MNRAPRTRLLAGCIFLLQAAAAMAMPAQGDRVYTADQNSNTVSVIDPASNRLLGQIRLGNTRPDVLSPIYKGEVNVHGLGFSPDHRTLVAISTASNSVAFIDTSSNRVKGIAYIGRAPHEGFFTPDGKAVWVVVRGEDYISVLDPVSFRETGRIVTAPGPGMIRFHPDGKRAFVVHSFTPEVDVIDVASHEILKRIPVVSPFSPFLQITPDGREVWLTHKDVGKVTRIDAATMAVKEVIDTGLVTNHLGFATTPAGMFAYVTVGAENVVKVYSMGDKAAQVATIPVGALPHGIWPSDDGSRMYVGLENGDGVDVIDTANNRVIARVPVGQAPQALVYVSGASQGGGAENLVPRVNQDSFTLDLTGAGQARGLVVVRNLGLADELTVSLYKLKPGATYDVFAQGQEAALGSFKSNEKGMASGTVIGPLRRIVPTADGSGVPRTVLYVSERDGQRGLQHAVLRSVER
jgi:YVTN family beta-propeller protein